MHTLTSSNLSFVLAFHTSVGLWGASV